MSNDFKNTAIIQLFEYCDCEGNEQIRVNIDIKYNGSNISKRIYRDKKDLENGKLAVLQMFEDLRKNIDNTLDNDLKPITIKEE